MAIADDAIRSLTRRIYGPVNGNAAFERIATLLERVSPVRASSHARFTESDVVLITYGDTIRSEGRPPLQTLCEFAGRYLKGSFSAIHLLPFFPYSSDDGFSVIDYLKINQELGNWQDVERIGSDFDLMFDFVLNHISAKSPWFQAYLMAAPGFQDFAIEMSRQDDLSAVTRPRALPLLTPFKKASGQEAWVWTTFSDDQIDLNYRSLDVLEKMIEVLLYYVSKGARLIRMDAVAYLWKQVGTSCIHLPQTHDMVRLFRAVLDHVAPDVLIITETNVPHEENVSYFGNGQDEAQMVYNFSLPPLLLHTFQSGDTRVLSRWARTLQTPSKRTAFFNFTASHDGIGVRPLEGILPAHHIRQLEEMSKQNGGRVSYKNNPDGTQSPYELNVMYIDALGGDVEKFLATQAIALVLPGVPGVYIHSLLGSRNWYAGVEKTGRARTINRQPLELEAVAEALADMNSFRAKVFYPYNHMLEVRRQQPAFHPNSGCDVIKLDHRVFSVRRFTENEAVYAVTNVAGDTVHISLKSAGAKGDLRDLLSHAIVSGDAIMLAPYQTLWLTDHT